MTTINGEPMADVPLWDGNVMWAMDLDRDGRPVGAHKVVRVQYRGDMNEIRYTACGTLLTQLNHPKGWWSFPSGELPLQRHAIHCGAEEGSGA